MTDHQKTDQQNITMQQQRVELIDVLRGIALMTMVVYHFTWDLEYFGWIGPATTMQTGWVIFARSIASSFLFLVGVSMVLAHRGGIEWQPFWKRWLQVAGAAALISIVSYMFMPGGFIFFGILHAIALFSLFGLLFLRLPWMVTLLVAVVVWVIWKTTRFDVFDLHALRWVGLAPIPPRSNDYVPLFPWFAATLAGIAFTQMALAHGLWQRLHGLKIADWLRRPMTFIGRRSLIFYLVHQPVLLASLWLFTAVVGEPDRAPAFIYHCQNSCLQTNGETFCRRYCTCMVDEMKSRNLFTPFMQGNTDSNQNDELMVSRDLCVAQDGN